MEPPKSNEQVDDDGEELQDVDMVTGRINVRLLGGIVNGPHVEARPDEVIP